MHGYIAFHFNEGYIISFATHAVDLVLGGCRILVAKYLMGYLLTFERTLNFERSVQYFSSKSVYRRIVLLSQL